MSLNRYDKRVDANQAVIVAFFRKAGAYVALVNGKGFDLLVSMYGYRPFIVEVKDGSKPPSERRLTEAEREMFTAMPYGYVVIESIEDAQRLLSKLRTEAC